MTRLIQLFLSPRKLLLVDASGALLSAFLLAKVLTELESIFGIPVDTLYFLAIFPCVFAVYDLLAYLLAQNNSQLKFCLKGIAYLNLFYCLLSLGAGVYHNEMITIWGWLYILTEILIVLVLARFEIKIANSLKIG